MISHIAQRRFLPPDEEPVRENAASANPSATLRSFDSTRSRRAPSLSRWLGFGVRLLFAAAVIAYFVVRYLAFVPRLAQS